MQPRDTNAIGDSICLQRKRTKTFLFHALERDIEYHGDAFVQLTGSWNRFLQRLSWRVNVTKCASNLIYSGGLDAI
jgi:hypothetical protein